MKTYALTAKQATAVAELQRAFAACRRAGVYFWDDYCEIRAVNGRVVESVCVDPHGMDGELDRSQATAVFSLPTGNADDTLYVKLRDRAPAQGAAALRAASTDSDKGSAA